MENIRFLVLLSIIPFHDLIIFLSRFQTERLRKGPKVVLDKTDIPRFLTPELFDKPKPKPKYKNGKKVKERAPRPKKPYVPKPKFLGPKSRDPKKIAAAAKKKAEASIYNNIITILSSDEEGAEEEEVIYVNWFVYFFVCLIVRSFICLFVRTDSNIKSLLRPKK